MGFKEQYFDIWQQVWSLHKKYYVIQEQDEKRWKQLNDECEAMSYTEWQGAPHSTTRKKTALCSETVKNSITI